ncbi:putative sarcoma antigen NY-SAR-97 [Toxoplasma gondii RUB]|uniref:Sarcoma antigen NY-SAR-97 n=5 Tax=Toxoplasma gondii TaxID=5811 RepID=S7V0Z9_TOXGG|nr:hypothetical protein TGGT1_247340 [Toxoplasma gondii GT1]KFG48128.1 putative sarcoma antigen NY-SAR-97 [Toxoplasma gondii p89]KFG53998.1 putative sarcoma antigen NY-SAR-97 [Toxoplasma gondii FOU]KFG64510.1 putative sarcoma antigen NY-SAR-97 [Toxoplasma gondii RUB]RQX72031.1 putative sarcoma antigen NY-SAR-97 [Toxoplasma gondii CAST]
MAQSAHFRGPFDPLGADSVIALCKLLNPEDEEDVHVTDRTVQRAHMGPGDLHERNKPRAKPNVKVEAKLKRSRGASGNKESSTLSSNTEAGSGSDPRVMPDYEILHQQTVGSEDVFLGMSGKDPSSDHCDKLVAKVRRYFCERSTITSVYQETRSSPLGSWCDVHRCRSQVKLPHTELKAITLKVSQGDF